MTDKMYEDYWGVLLQPWEEPVETRTQTFIRIDNSGGGSCEDTGCGPTCSGSCDSSCDSCGSCDPDCDETEKKKKKVGDRPKPPEKPKSQLVDALD
ncbi:MAG TPA: hypothetical protein VFA74_16145 [Terriglobales bacterium]|nr:hypothetical protein [Terriglobales bacterium]